MTCKDCVHYEVCRHFVDLINSLLADHNRIDINENTDICKEHFQDRSRFLELPCKLGDEIFCTTMGKIYQGIVGRIELDDEGFAIITTDGYCVDSTICYHTQEEAEQALKERIENDA